jgi:transcriptional regulator with XRE-family HTH domain
MDRFASQLKQRAKELGISQSEAARRSGLSEGRYAHYANGRREPDLSTLLRIAKGLETTPNALLGVDGKKKEGSTRALLHERLISAADALRDRDLELAIAQIEALANFRHRSR